MSWQQQYFCSWTSCICLCYFLYLFVFFYVAKSFLKVVNMCINFLVFYSFAVFTCKHDILYVLWKWWWPFVHVFSLAAVHEAQVQERGFDT